MSDRENTDSRFYGASGEVVCGHHVTCKECFEDWHTLELERDRLRKALAFIAADRKLTVDHLRGYADGVLQGLAAEAEGRETGR